MPDSSIKHCIDLCTKALGQTDNERSQTLDELRDALFDIANHYRPEI